jgi:DNA/RNA-binding domain of Phe-tRNA-synthetase-like protein
MYKEMGVDWHSKRPSPEALLRRIATGKGLYPAINTCVDAYNLIVMKNKISVGAFDLDKMKLPSIGKNCRRRGAVLLYRRCYRSNYT